MLEATLVLSGLLAGGLVWMFATSVTASALVVLGLAVLCLGLCIGVPTGLWYHVVLYRIVSPRVAVPRRWWLSPSSLHAHLTAADWRRITPWYRIGGVGFMLCVLGGAAAIAASLLLRG